MSASSLDTAVPITPEQLEQLTEAEFAAILADDPRQASRWIRAAAEHGIVQAQAMWGQILLEGRGTEKNPEEAYQWFKHAAYQDHPHAMNMLARCYEHGWGTPHNPVVAAFWYKKAANTGLDWGMYNYANLLIKGYGVKADRAEALKWYRQAASLGHAKSINIIGRFHEEGWEVQQDIGLATAYYKQAAIGGDFRGQFNYARMLINAGEAAEAVKWLMKIPETATEVFMQDLLGYLETSTHPVLRQAAAKLKDRA